MNLLKDILETMDKNTEKYNDFLFTSDIKTTYVTDVDIEHNIITFYNKNKTFESKYETIATYDIINDSSNPTYKGNWTWAWADPYLNKNESKLSRSILNYAFNIESNNSDNIFIKSLLLKSHILIKSNIHVELLLSIVSSLIKIPLIKKVQNEKNQITYYCIIDYKKLKL